MRRAFGAVRLFATVTPLDIDYVDLATEETAYTLDELKAGGARFFTRYGDRCLGYAEFHTLRAEINKRGTVVFTHPTNQFSQP